ncbi:hypothetical protein GCM10010967_13160 [Dyadobacter beijingensis]|uniref:ATPase dynein-related AAA domain-containing protein n=1 Tax=Dyadobacter beijingensis TaxID=365489 RepID=A0ABQ2HIU3_9BACT|nr:AAA family ATPase [Dyadobacter beijingensis]GGM82818.1 hypothetical protein GCM10010967_13160 [Dyadobacter beijingensis]
MEIEYYCAGFTWNDGKDSQLQRFIRDGIWENGYDDKHLEVIKKIPVGSKIAAKTSFTRKKNGETISVLGVHAIGVVTDNPGDGKHLSVDWEKNFQPFEVEKGGAYRSTMTRVASQKNIDLIFGNKPSHEINNMELEPDAGVQNFPLNQILYGPPGTGKTYLTIKKAVAIIDGLDDGDLAGKSREDLKTRFEELKQTGQIEFCTFHQNMSYEDFIEGIKPAISENNQVIYDIQPGVFKKLATKANDNLLFANSTDSGRITFDEAFDMLQNEWEENKEMKFPLVREGKEYTILGFTNTSIRFRKASGGSGHTLSIGTLKEQFYGTRQMQKTGVGIYYPALLRKLNSYKSPEPVDKQEKRYVLIIDEINRGNVSQIFGELISLIEDDKRLGASEYLEALLPYSKEKFGVPSNLYIIGTMNTADRSVEALDTALRRRFSFQEISPNPELLEKDIEGFPLKDILITINKRIEKLLDRDHLIGHSYFLAVHNLFDLKLTFQNKIIPLLQEYFFGDYGKIGLVLGQGFINVEEVSEPNLFAKFDYSDSEAFNERPVYTLQNASAMSDEAFVNALKLLINK